MQKGPAILTGVLTILIVFIIYSANTGQSIPAAHHLRSMAYGDKLAHFFLFGLLSFLLNLALAIKRFEFGRLSVYRGSVLIAIVALIEEISQRYIATRAFEYYDLLADFSGIVFFALLTSLYANRQLNHIANKAH